MVGVNLAIMSSTLPNSWSIASLILPDGGSNSCAALTIQSRTCVQTVVSALLATMHGPQCKAHPLAAGLACCIWSQARVCRLLLLFARADECTPTCRTKHVILRNLHKIKAGG